MNRSKLVIYLRNLLLRMENEEWELDEELGTAWIMVDSKSKQYIGNGIDTFTLRFLGPKQKTAIPPITVVYCDGKTEERSYTNVRGLINAVYLYCPIDPATITPEYHRRKVLTHFKLSNVQYIKENQ